jgi:hypothetical protein
MLLYPKTENACQIFVHTSECSKCVSRYELPADGWKVAPIPAEVFNVNSHDSAWVNAQCTPQSLASLEEPIKLRGGLARIQDVTHILATGWGGSGSSPIPASHERAKMKGWRTRTMACGHEVMLDLPKELTDLLLEYASS